MFDPDLKGGVKDLFLKGHRCSLEILIQVLWLNLLFHS